MFMHGVRARTNLYKLNGYYSGSTKTLKTAKCYIEDDVNMYTIN